MGTINLQEVNLNEVKKFSEKMKDDLPNSVHALRFISTLVEWRVKQPELEIRLLAPNGNPSLGLIFYFIFKNMFIGSVYAEDASAVTALQESILATNEVPYLGKASAQFSNLNELASKTVNGLMLTSDWQLGSDFTIENKTYWLPWQRAKEIEVRIPPGVEIRNLTKDHAKLINEHWPHKFKDSEELIEMIIELNFGLGVFRGESLLSWALLWYYGGIGSVQTLEEERRKGYGQAVVSAMAKRMGDMEVDVHLIVIDGNEKGERFFKSLGFMYAFPSVWVVRLSSKVTVEGNLK